MQNGERPTLADVAERAGVSIATVSRVMNGLPTRKSTRTHVEKIARELNYVPNRMARSLRTSSSHFVGAIVPDLGHGSYARMLHAAQQVLEAAQYELVLISTHRDPQKDQQALRVMIDNRVEGLLIASSGGITELPDVPTVFFDNHVQLPGATNVLPSNTQGVELLIAHLHDHHGYVDIAYLGPPPRLTAATERLDAYHASMRRRGLIPRHIEADAQWSPESAERAVRTLHSTEGLPRAIMAASDTVALGALHAAIQEGVNVPRDLAVVSFDDSLHGAYTYPPLTALASIDARIGEISTQLLLRRIAEETSEGLEVRIPLELITRESCGCAAPSQGNWSGPAESALQEGVATRAPDLTRPGPHQ